MKESIKTVILLLPKKLKLELRISIDSERNPIYNNINNQTGDLSTTISLFPSIIMTMIHSNNEERVPWSRDDTVMMTKYTYPIFCHELGQLLEDIKIPELYSYSDKVLILNESLADKKKKVFKLFNTLIELSPVVIVPENPDDPYAEGIKIKFNNESHTIILNLNEAIALLWNMNHMDIDSMTILLYNGFYKNINDVPFDVNENKESKLPTLDDKI